MDDHHSKHIFAEVRIHASVEQVWRVITDYDNLADFVPNLVVSERLPSNVTGRIQLRQIGCSQSVFWRLEAEAVLECVEVHKAMGAKELRFKAVEGDFQVSIACLAMQICPSAPLCVHQFILHASCMTCVCLSSSKHPLRCSSTKTYQSKPSYFLQFLQACYIQCYLPFATKLHAHTSILLELCAGCTCSLYICIRLPMPLCRSTVDRGWLSQTPLPIPQRCSSMKSAFSPSCPFLQRLSHAL